MIRVEIRGNVPVKVRLKLVKKVHEVLTHPLTILRIMGSIVKGQEVVKAHGSQAVAAVPPYPHIVAHWGESVKSGGGLPERQHRLSPLSNNSSGGSQGPGIASWQFPSPPDDGTFHCAHA